MQTILDDGCDVKSACDLATAEMQQRLYLRARCIVLVLSDFLHEDKAGEDF